MSVHLHQWSHWSDLETVSIYWDENDRTPIKRKLIQIKRCGRCGRAKTRRVTA